MFYPMEKTWRLNRGKLLSRVPQGIWLGNSIPEYAVIALFLIFISLAGIQLLSANLNTAMAKVRDDMKTHQQAAQSVLAAEQAAAAAAASGASGSGAGLTAAQAALLQQSLADKIQTTGANGATELLANQLTAAAELLLQQGKIDASQYDILMQLANQGHRIAAIQDLISNALATANGDVNVFNNMTLYFDGGTYTATQLSQMIGTEAYPEVLTNTNILSLDASDTSLVDPELAKFITLYNQALSSGALSDPTALSTVTSASQQIGNMGESVEDTVWNVSINAVSPDTAAVTTAVATRTTDMNSSAICAAGSFDDSGVLCSL